MATRAPIKVGDVFAIPLADQAYVLALCMFVFHDKHCIACRIFDALFDAPKMVEPMPENVAFEPLFMGKKIITAGTWPIVGKISDVAGPVLFRVAGAAGSDELPELSALGPIAVQNVLRLHFGLV